MVNQITIRVVNKTTGKVKNVFPSIANNKQLMKTSGMEISDPQYDAKMEAFRNNRPFIENGKAKEPVKESFFSPISIQSDNPKSCCENTNETRESCKPIYIEPTQDQQAFLQSRIDREISKSVVDPVKPKRTRRTKEQMKQSKLQK